MHFLSSMGSHGVAHEVWPYGVVVSMFDFHSSDEGSNPGCGGKIHNVYEAIHYSASSMIVRFEGKIGSHK